MGLRDGSNIRWTYANNLYRCREITTPTPHYSIFTGRMLFLMPNLQRQRTEGNFTVLDAEDKSK